jgi:hypothetical protein
MSGRTGMGGRTTRRQLLTMAGGLAGGTLLAGCTVHPTTRPAAVPGSGVPDVLVVDTTAGLAVVRNTGTQLVGAGLPSLAGSAVYATVAAGNDTLLQRVETRTGQVTARTGLHGRWVPRVVSSDGLHVALTAPADVGSPPVGREKSTILIADGASATGGGERYRLELPGNFEPDAFARDGTALFVLEWLPPKAPDRYRVRLVELATGRFTEMFTREKVPVPVGTEEQMRGQRRQAVSAPGGQTLYTLYTQQPGKGPVDGGWETESPAFVHTLDTQVGWAYCLDLPDPFGTGPAAAHTVNVTPDGRLLLVADLSTGHLAIADTETLKVVNVLDVPNGSGTAYSAVSADSKRVYLGIGTALTVVDLSILNVTARWDAHGQVRGLALSQDDTRLLVGYPDAVGWCAAADGEPQGRVPVAGLTDVRRAL